MYHFKFAIIVSLVSGCFWLGSCNEHAKSDSATQQHDHQKTDRTSRTVNNYQMDLTAAPLPIEIGKPVTITMKVKNTVNENEPVLLDVVHDKKIHLVVVSEDLAWFDHIHPEQQRDGSYTVDESFLHGGNYILFADYRPTGSEQLVHKTELNVQGKPAATALSQGQKLSSSVDGYTVTLVNGSELKTNADQNLNLSIEKDGRKLTAANLEQYLGAAAHIVMISKAGKEYIHIHSGSDGRFPVTGKARFINPGIYRMWVQFQTNGLVHTADLTVNVTAGDTLHTKDPVNKEHQH